MAMLVKQRDFFFPSSTHDINPPFTTCGWEVVSVFTLWCVSCICVSVQQNQVHTQLDNALHVMYTNAYAHNGTHKNALQTHRQHIIQDVSYLSTPWGPAGLFDFPNYSSHQQQRQETAGQRRQTDDKSIQNQWFLSSAWTRICKKNKTTSHQAALDGNNLKNRFTSRNKRLYKKSEQMAFNQETTCFFCFF